MIKRFLKKIKRNYEEALTERLAHIDDPLAKTIDWSPLKGGGTNFRTHHLVKDLYRLNYKASKGAILFASIFIAIGSGVPSWILYENYNKGYQITNWENMIVAGAALLFLVVGIFMIKQFTTPITFDKHVGFLWKGRKQPEMYGRNNPKDAIRLSNIHALQIITERVKSDNGSYHSYEINVITKDGERMNVIDHGDQKSIYEDVRTLSEFLNVPVWDLHPSVDLEE